jgi:hypothetical protein
MKTVTIDHPHAEVIAAYYSGKAIEYFEGGCWKPAALKGAFHPTFSPIVEYRIKPEPLVRWVVVDGDPNNICYDNQEDAERALGSIRRRCDARIVRMVEPTE